MKKFGKLMGAVVPFFAVIGIQLVVSVMMSTVFSIIYAFKEAIKGNKDMLTNSQQISKTLTEELTNSSDFILLLSISATLISGIVFFFWFRKINRASLKVNPIKRLSIKSIVLIILLGIGCQACIDGVLNFVQPFFKDLFADYTKTMNSLLNGNLFFVILYTIFIAPFAEELVFRGVILHKAGRVIPFMGANILQAALFGIYHWNIIQGIYAFLLGLVLGCMVRKFDTIYASILLHMCVNASSFLFVFIPVNTPSNIILVVLGGILLAVCFIQLMKTVIKPLEQVIYGMDHIQ